MANEDKPSGARIIGNHSGFYEGQLTKMFIPATDSVATYINDIVKIAGSADADGVATCAQVTAGETPCGIIVGMEPDYTNLELKYRAASTARYVWVNTDPNVVFEIQASTTFAAANVGLNADVVIPAAPDSGSALSGLSFTELDSTTILATATLVLAIEGIIQREDNEIGNNAKVLCSFNVHQYGSVGVLGL